MKVNNIAFLEWAYILLSTLLLLSCTTSLDKSASLTGQVCLDGTEDHSGVSVALYELTDLDQDILDINREFTSIGVIMSQQTEFDHRLQSPVLYTLTGADGNFAINDIRTGRYNLAFLKEGFGVKYVYDIVLEQGSNVLSGGTVFLSLITVMPQTVTSSFVFKSEMQYYFPFNTVITAPVTIESGSILAVEAGRRVDFYGVTNPENYWWLTSAYSLNSMEGVPSILSHFDRVSIHSAEHVEISNAKITFANTGLIITAPSAKIKKSYFNHNNTAIVINGGEVVVQNILHLNSNNRSINFDINQGINSNKILYIDNISKNNFIALYCSVVPIKIENNFMLSNDTAVYVWDGVIEAKFNIFFDNVKSIESLGSVATIQHNEFRGVRAVDIIFGESRGNRANGVINFNNFFETRNLYLRMTTSNGLIGVMSDIDATNNYFINQNIENQIWDKNRNQNLVYEFVYTPRADTPWKYDHETK